MRKKTHIGSDFDDFLKKEGLLADAEAVAVKRVLAYQFAKMMEKKKLSKSMCWLKKKMALSQLQ